MLKPNGKKLTSSLLILFMLLSLFPASILADPAAEYFDTVIVLDDPVEEDLDTAMIPDDLIVEEDSDIVMIPGDLIAEEDSNPIETIASAPSSSDIWTVTFDSAGGTTKKAIKVNDGNTAVKPTDPTKTGFAFDGWFLKDSDELFDFDTPVTENITLKAQWSTAILTIEFDTADGTPIDPVYVEYGAKVAKPADPEREGYTFAGWLKGTTTYNFNTAVKTSFTLKAKWTAISYTVKFDSAGGTSKSSAKVNHGNKVTKPSNPTKAGFTFEGWFLADSDDPYDFNTPVTESFTLKAGWSDTICIIEFNTADGTPIDSVEVAYGAKLERPEDPERDGYTFAGWLKGTTTYNFNTAVKTSFTLKAKWTAITYTVKYDSNGGTVKASAKVNEGSAAKKPTNPTRIGYTFEGWYLDDTDELYDFDTPVYENIILMAQWSRKYFEIKFDTGEGTEIDPVTVEYGQKIERPEDPERDGYTFGGWYKGLLIYNFGSPVTSEFTIKAKWNPITYTVTFDANGGTARVPAKVNEGNKVSKPTNPVKPGYTFEGWYLDGTDELYDFSTPVYENIILEAKWTQKLYDIAFDTAGGSPTIDTVTLEYGQKLVRPEDPEREGYTFVCWMKGVLPYSFTLPVTESFTLKAKWNPIVYLVTYDTQGAIPRLPVAVKHGELVTRPTNPTRIGYTFDGWFLSGSDTPYDFRTPLTSSITLSARWTKK